MKRKPLILVTLIFMGAFLCSQVCAGPQSDEQMHGRERLAGLCRLWGVVKYFHPDLATRNIDWDGALVRIIPRILEAGSRNAYRDAIEKMLNELNDPLTRVAADDSPDLQKEEAAGSKKSPAEPALEWVEDRIAVMRIQDYAFFTDRAKAMGLKKIFEKAAGAESFIFDLRRRDGRTGVDSAPFYFGRYFRMFFPMLLSADVPMPVERYRMYSGYSTQRGGYGGYYGGFVTPDSRVLKAESKESGSNRPMIFILNSESVGLDDLITGLQVQGTAKVVAVGKPRSGEGGMIHVVELPEDLKVFVRTGQRINPDGSMESPPDLVIDEDSETQVSDSALKIALGILRGEWKTAHHKPDLIKPAGLVILEKPYADMSYPDLGYRLLSLFRYWNVIHYFFPYKHLMDRSWDDVLLEFIPRFMKAKDELDYNLAVAELGSRIQDTHGFMYSPVLGRYFGDHFPPLEVKTVEGKAVITHVFDETATEAGLQVGDIIISVGGETAAERRARLSRYLSVSTPQALNWRLDGLLLGGDKDSLCKMLVEKGDGSKLEVELIRSARRRRSERPYPVFTVLPEGFGYADLARLTVPQVDEAFEKFFNAPAVIFDMRGYPRGTAWSIAPRLATEKVPVALFQRPEIHATMLDQPSIKRFYQYTEPSSGKPRYTGRIVVLIDENAISQAEHTCLFLESVAETTFVGTPTNGANGDVTMTVLPGGISANFTGHDVRHADGRQLQRVGIRPDIEVAPTIAGIREGKDEILQAAIEFLQKVLNR